MTKPRPTTDARWPTGAWILAIGVFVVLLVLMAVVLAVVGPGTGWGDLRIWIIVIAPLYWWTVRRTLTRRYGQARTKAEDAYQATREIVWRRRFFVFAMPVIAVALVAIGAVDVGPEVRAMRQDGPAGTFIVWSVECGRWSCTYDGHFVSDDSKVVRDNVRFLDSLPSGTAVGARVRARDTGHRLGVFAESGTGLDWFLIPALGAAYLLGWAGWLLRRQGRDRRTRNIP